MTYILFRKRTFFLLAASILLVFIAKPTPGAFWIGLPFTLIGVVIRLWSAGYLTKMSGLVTAGPFAFCRNPLYIGSFFISVGYFIMCNRIDVWIVGTVLFWLFHGGAVVYEEQLLREKFKEEYIQYCKSVPRFLPFPQRFARNGSFSLKRIMTNNEYRSVLSTMILLALFGLMAYNNFSIITWLSDAFTG